MADSNRVVRCKMVLTERAERGARNAERQVALTFQVVSPYNKDDITPEDKDFFKWTPYGELKFGTINYDAADGLELGTEYYIDIVKAGGNDGATH